MQYRILGRTGLEVSAVSMGTWKSFDVRGPKEIEHVHALVTEALRCGVNLFDTAPMYGAAENVLGEVLKGRRRDVIVATKVLAYDQRSARTLIEESFRKLQVEVIDLMQIHNMSAWREVTPVLEEYKAKGRIRFLGITDYRTSMFPEMMQSMRTGKFDTIQIPYNLGDRAAEREIIPLAKQLNLGVLVMTPMFIALPSREPFGFAGLWETWKAPDGEAVQSCTIITTTPNALMESIHNRMPVILPRAAEEVWLDRTVDDPQRLLPLLKPYADTEMTAYEVSLLVNSPRNDVPACIEPVQ